MKIGYARVSSTDQDLEIQMGQLKEFGCEKIFSEKASGTTKDGRPQFLAAIDYCREGDVLVVTRADRMSRTVIDMLNVCNDLMKKGVGFVAIHQPEVSMETSTGRALLAILGVCAEVEQSLRRERSREGFEKAKREGRLGKPPKMPVDVARKKILRMRDVEKRSAGSIGRELGYSWGSIKRIVPTGWPYYDHAKKEFDWTVIDGVKIEVAAEEGVRA